MAILKLVEDYAVNYARTQVRDSLMYHGEQAILISLFHPEIDDVGRCPRCAWDAYRDGENMCPVCFGTGLFDTVNQVGGIKDASRVWCQFGDYTVSEQYGQRGVMAPRTREVQCEAFPMLTEHDIIARIAQWDENFTALSEPEFYSVDAVTQNSLRTGNRYGQSWQDVIGQKAQCSWLPPNSNGIQLYPIQGQVFPAAQITGTPVPVAVVQPDTKVVFYPVSSAAGAVSGAVPGNLGEPSFTFTQSAPAQVWTISHTLGHLPQVTIIVGGAEVDADVDYPNINTVTVTFAAPQAGTAELI